MLIEKASDLILVVEDNPTNAKLTGAMLTAAGYRTSFAVDGKEGFEKCQQCRPALIVTDLQMPGIDGLTLIRLLKANQDTCHIPIIVLTAHVMREHRDQALDAGCASFISKPVRFQPFVAEIARILSAPVKATTHESC